ncbi:Gamma-glutamylcyclotransferase [Mycena indigotica]|uniref:Gamma-glutamylcyclotransferase n=1 Tax=Mycena indigotica TaxID=2126181 RepID=A0A8H6S9B9_9AGAR|nr:Gamma-glutamylcyclotransferase [Mycena indigotica]KAF7295385.1 Gamma-glutamylcyclotransferase [Mycena indigotica]
MGMQAQLAQLNVALNPDAVHAHPPAPPPTRYFGYGSNLWIHQMDTRCPGNTLLGVAFLRDWRWIINTRGTPRSCPPGLRRVRAAVHRHRHGRGRARPPTGRPRVVVKQTHPVTLVGPDGSHSTTPDALVYVDVQRTREGPPKPEYVHRINSGICDAVRAGVPEEPVEAGALAAALGRLG